MEAPNGPHSYRDDIPDDVAQRIRLLREQEQQIETLEAQLRALRRSHTALRKELVPYLVTASSMLPESDGSLQNAAIQKIIPIESCPDEVLNIIFGLCIAECHSRIAILLQVCRHWHHLIMNSPILWARLQINQTNYRSFIDPSNKKFDSYKFACMDRSKGGPITIDLNFSLLPDPENFMKEILDTLPYFQEWRDEVYPLIFSLNDLSWEQFVDTGYYYYLRDGIRCLAILANPDIKLSNSLAVVLPSSGNMTRAILDFIHGFGLNPSTLSIPRYHNSSWEEMIAEDGIFWNLSDVKTLITHNLEYPLKLGVHKSTLRHLELTLDGMYHDMTDLSLLTSLLSLTLHGSYWVKDLPPVSITLPTLKRLSLNGYVAVLCTIDWKLPLLGEFALCEYGIPAIVPQISALNLQLIDYSIYIDKTSGIEKQSKLLAMMDLSPSVQTLTVPSQWRTAAIQAIIQYRSEGKLASLYKLVVVEKEKAPEELYMRDLTRVEEW